MRAVDGKQRIYLEWPNVLTAVDDGHPYPYSHPHAFFCSIILTIKKGGQITSQLELKEITLRCSKSEYRTQLNYKGSVLNF